MSTRQTGRRRPADQLAARSLPTSGASVKRRSSTGVPREDFETEAPRRTNVRTRTRRGPRKMSKETSQWVFAGGVFAAFMLAVIVGIHVIGGTTSPTASGSRTPGAFGGRGGFPGGFGGSGANSQILSAVAGALNLSTTSLTADLQAGQTVPQLATAQNVSLTTVDNAYLNAVQQQFNSAVSSGQLSQTQANQIYSQQQQDVQNGQFPLLQSFAQPSGTATP